MHREVLSIQFVKYATIGLSTFALDLALLYVLIDYVKLHYAPAAAIAFLIAVSLNYGLSRRYVFAGTSRSLREGYVIFLVIAGGGLVIVTGLMVLLVDVASLEPLLARSLVAGVVGVWNYLMNLYINFRPVRQEER